MPRSSTPGQITNSATWAACSTQRITRRAGSLDEDAALVLFHSDNRRFAVQVDEIVGTREIVVKSLGPQFSAVPGLGGATILSDGQVVVIIDLNELARVAIADAPRWPRG